MATPPRSTLAVLAVVLLATPVQAQPVSGTAVLRGGSKLSVQRCGHGRASFSAVVGVGADGTWTAMLDEGASLSGTWAAGRGNALALTFDPPSLAAFVAGIEEDASELCETAVTAASNSAKAFTLRVDRRHRRARLVLKYRFTGSAAGRSGRATVSLRGAGPWTDA